MSPYTFTEPVHVCRWAQQPDLQLLCTQRMTTPAWPAWTLDNDVYRTATGELYTFVTAKVTCPACRAADAARP